jgi:gas vesicle protein
MGKRDGGGGGFFAGFLVGAIVGGAAAVLLTQEETRDLLAGKAREASNLAMDKTGDLRGKVSGKVSDVTSQWQSSVSELYERGRQVVENARASLDAAVAEGQATAEETRDELQRKAEG